MLSLVFPTYNRPDFALRQLAYYDSLPFDRNVLKILIGDSSTGRDEELMRELVRVYGERGLQVSYVPCPKKNVVQATQDLMEAVDTPYAAWTGDDDFLVPEAMFEAVEYLEQHRDYSSALGHCVKFFTQDNEAFAPIHMVKYRRQQPEIGEDGAGDRMLHFFELHPNYEPLFSVHRTDVQRDLYRYAYTSKYVKFAATFFPNLLSVVAGKSKLLDGLAVIRQKNYSNIIYASSAETCAWMLREDWSSEAAFFRDEIVRAVAARDGDEEAARVKFQLGFANRFSRMLAKEYTAAKPDTQFQMHARGAAVPVFEEAPPARAGLRERLAQRWSSLRRRPSLQYRTFDYLMQSSGADHRRFMEAHRIVGSDLKSLPFGEEIAKRERRPIGGRRIEE